MSQGERVRGAFAPAGDDLAHFPNTHETWLRALGDAGDGVNARLARADLAALARSGHDWAEPLLAAFNSGLAPDAVYDVVKGGVTGWLWGSELLLVGNRLRGRWVAAEWFPFDGSMKSYEDCVRAYAFFVGSYRKLNEADRLAFLSGEFRR